MLREIIIQIKNDHKLIKLLVVLIISGISLQAILGSLIPDPYPDYNIFIIPFVENCHLSKYPERDGVILNPDNVTATHSGQYTPTRDPLKWWVNCLSFKITNNPKIIPVFFNIGLMPLVYLLALNLTRDRFLSLISLIAFCLNPLYYNWISSGTYDQVWSFFLLLSMYLLFKTKKSTLSPFSLALSIAAKSLTLLYLPAWLYSLKELVTNKKIKLEIIMILASIILVTLIFLSKSQINIIGGTIGFYPNHLHDVTWGNWELLWPEIPFIMVFFLISVNFRPLHPSPNRNICLVWMLNALLTTPLIYLFTNQFQFVYRFVPLAVFMSIFISITINDLGKFIIDNKLNRIKP